MRDEKGKGYEQRDALRKQKRELEKLEMSRKERKDANREDRKSASKKRTRNKEFARVTYAFVGIFLVMMGYLAYFNVTKSRDMIRSPYNKRQDNYADRVVRGNIVDRNGNILATTEWDENGAEYRNYPYGNICAHVVGYTENGKSGLESLGNFELLTSNAFFIEKIKNEFQGSKNMGDTVVSTLDVNLQEAAYNALDGYKGAVVAMEPDTGKILAMISKPDFNPNEMSYMWEDLNSDQENSPLLNRATQGLYAPGSTFKVISALEYIRENSNYEDYYYNCTGEIWSGDVCIQCYNHGIHGDVDLRNSLAYSCNTSFSNIGAGLDVNRFRQTTKELLFDGKLPSELPYAQSRFTLNSNSPEAEKMMTSMGQGMTQVSPYHMALVTAAIANGGTLMRPYLIDSVTNYKGSVIEKNKPRKYKELMMPGEASVLKDYMTSVVDYGTATILSGQGYTAAGKTGTAEYSTDEEKDHSWFIGIADVDNPKLVISVIIESSDGTASAVNIARQVFDVYYSE